MDWFRTTGIAGWYDSRLAPVSYNFGMPAANSTTRFSDRVENYVRYRPGYPREVVQLLRRECGLARDQAVADIASGTGIWTRMLLETGARVFGVEPNAGMRQAGENQLASYQNFTSVAGTAEETNLPDRFVHLVTAAQAGHWFDRARARHEFVRILQPGGWLALIWNERETGATAFLREYEQLLLTYGSDYEKVRHEHTTASVNEFFDPQTFQERDFAMAQEFDYAGLEGRLLSSSYAPKQGEPKHAPMLAELGSLFDRHQQDGKVFVSYRTRVFYGQMR